MHMRFGLCLLTAGAVPFAAHAIALDCAKATLPLEKTICADRSLSTLDERMGQVYREALGRVSSRTVGELRVDQLQWLAWMQQVCGTDAPGAVPSAVSQCMQPVYNARIRVLSTTVVRRNGVGFVTRTQYLASPNIAADGRPDPPTPGTLQAAWPEADSADEPWTAWNTAVEQTVLKAAGATPGAGTGTRAWTEDLAVGADTTLSATVRSIEHDRVTTAVRTTTRRHGATRGSESFQTLTWLLPDERPLRAADVFVPGQKWRSDVSRACWSQLTQSGQASLLPAVRGADSKELLDIIDDTANWTLEPDGLHISYPVSAAAANGATPDDAVLSWTVLRPVLKQEFPTP